MSAHRDQIGPQTHQPYPQDSQKLKLKEIPNDLTNNYYMELYKDAAHQTVQNIVNSFNVDEIIKIMGEEDDPEVDYPINIYLGQFKLEVGKQLLEAFYETCDETGVEEYLFDNYIFEEKRKILLGYDCMKKRLPPTYSGRKLEHLARMIQRFEDCVNVFKFK